MWVSESVRDKRERSFSKLLTSSVGKILTPSARIAYSKCNHDAIRTCRIGSGNVVPVINPDAAVEVVQPNENGNQRESRYHVNLNARTCTCTNWHFNGIACCHALKAWDVYHARLGGQLETVVSRCKVSRSRRSFKRGADPTSSRCRNRGR